MSGGVVVPMLAVSDDEDDLAFLVARTNRYAWIDPSLWVEDPGVFRVKTVGRFHVDVMPMMYTSAIVMTPVSDPCGGYVDRWCYHTNQVALAAAKAWDGTWPLSEPEGWHRHPVTGRRRPDGDPSREEIRP